MKRKQIIVSRRDWDTMMSSEDGNLQEELAERLDSFQAGPNVRYWGDSLGNIDSDSSPAPTDQQTDEEGEWEEREEREYQELRDQELRDRELADN